MTAKRLGLIAAVLLAGNAWPAPPPSITRPPAVAPPPPLSAFDASGLPDRTFRELNELLHVPLPRVPPPQITKNLNDHVQLRVLGAPVPAQPGETPATQEQPRVPIISITW